MISVVQVELVPVSGLSRGSSSVVTLAAVSGSVTKET